MMKPDLKYLLEIKDSKLWTDLFIVDIEDPSAKTIEISPAKTLKINTKLTNQQEQKLLDVLKRNIESFAWDYKDMKEYILPFVLTIFTSKRTANLLGSPKEG
jgi:hypothetical protein